MSEIEIRGLEAYEMLNKGLKKTKVINYFIDTYRVSRETAISYIDQGLKYIKFDTGYTKEEAKDILSSLYMEVYRKNMDEGDYRNAESVLDKMSTMFGAKEPNKIDITTNGESINREVELINSMTIEELKAIDSAHRIVEKVEERIKG